MNEIIIGIDLGTTNSAVCCLRNGRPSIIQVDDAPTMPSCVGLAPDGTLLVGREALNQYTVYPERTVRSIKRKMGLDYRVSLGDREFSPEEISALILQKLKTAAETELGQPIQKAVITVPAYFDENQRKATRRAGEMAGLEVARILNEPTAAALAYGANRKDCEKVLVYDLGGGTFDASLIVSENGVVEVMSSHGDTALGGDDFDEVLVRRAARSFVEAGGPDPLKDAIAHNRLKIRMEQAKITLSTAPFAKVEEAFFFENHNLMLEVSREEYEKDIRALLEKTIGCCAQCLHDASIRSTKLDRIILVGGASHTPLVHALIQEHFEIEPRYEIDPDLIVAYGAALQGAAIAGVSDVGILVDITPYHLGIRALEASYDRFRFAPVIRRNSPLPTNRTEVFYTCSDDQEAVEVIVYQGETETLEQNQRIGEFVVEGLDEAPAGDAVLVNFKLNLNGMLEVTATQKCSGRSKSVVLDSGGRSPETNIESARNRLSALWAETTPTLEGPESTESAETPATEKLHKRAEKLLADGGLDEEDRAEIETLLEKSTAAREAGATDELNELNAELEDILFYLED